MLYLVTIPNRRKRIQQNAESAQEAIDAIWKRLDERHKVGVSRADCFAEECADPMSQFVKTDDSEVVLDSILEEKENGI